MRKNIFSWKSLAGLTLLFGLTMGISSCQQVELPDDPANQTPAETPVEVGAKISGSTITVTATTLQEVSRILADQNPEDGTPLTDDNGNALTPVTKAIKKYAGDELTIVINSADLVVAYTEDKNGNDISADVNTLVLPNNKLNDTDVDLQFTSLFKKNDGSVWYIRDINNLDNLNITLPNGDMGKLNIYTQYSTVKAVSAGKTDIELSAWIGSNYSLTLGSGLNVSVNLYDITNNVIANGATIAAVIADNESASVTKAGINSGVYNQKVNANNLISVKNLIVRNWAAAVGYNDDIVASPLNKITVESGADLTFNTAAKEVVGILNSKGEVTAKATATYSSRFMTIEKISNIKFSGNFTATIKAEITNSTLKFDHYIFDAALSSIQDVKFDTNQNTGYDTNFKVNVPAQENANSYTFTFKNAEFPAGARFNTNAWDNTLPELDADGNPVKVTWYYWNTGDYNYNYRYDTGYWSFADEDEADTFIADNNFVVGNLLTYWGASSLGVIYDVQKWDSQNGSDYPWRVRVYYYPAITKRSQTFTEIPVDLRKAYPAANSAGNIWWYTRVDAAYYDVDYDNFTFIFAFANCKIDGKKFTAKADAFTDANCAPGAKVRYDIDGKLYRTVQGDNTLTWFLTDAESGEAK